MGHRRLLVEGEDVVVVVDLAHVLLEQSVYSSFVLSLYMWSSNLSDRAKDHHVTNLVM